MRFLRLFQSWTKVGQSSLQFFVDEYGDPRPSASENDDSQFSTQCHLVPTQAFRSPNFIFGFRFRFCSLSPNSSPNEGFKSQKQNGFGLKNVVRKAWGVEAAEGQPKRRTASRKLIASGHFLSLNWWVWIRKSKPTFVHNVLKVQVEWGLWGENVALKINSFLRESALSKSWLRLSTRTCLLEVSAEKTQSLAFNLATIKWTKMQTACLVETNSRDFAVYQSI